MVAFTAGFLALPETFESSNRASRRLNLLLSASDLLFSASDLLFSASNLLFSASNLLISASNLLFSVVLFSTVFCAVLW